MAFERPDFIEHVTKIEYDIIHRLGRLLNSHLVVS
jgi:hypothetical protein